MRRGARRVRPPLRRRPRRRPRPGRGRLPPALSRDSRTSSRASGGAWKRCSPEAAGPEEAAPPRAPSRPADLGRYRIERELGRGAQGTVFLALDTPRRPPRRAQGPEDVLVGIRRDGEALRARGAGARAIRPSWDRGDPRRRVGARPRVLRDALRRGPHARARARRARPGSEARRRRPRGSTLRYVDDHREVRASAARRARERSRPPRRQAFERHDHRGRRARASSTSASPASSTRGTTRLTGTGRRPRARRTSWRPSRSPETAPGSTAAPTSTRSRRRCARSSRRALGDARRSSRDLDAVLETATDPVPDRRYATAAALRRRPRARAPRRARRRAAGRARPQARDAGSRRAPSAAALVPSCRPLVLLAGLVALALKNDEIEAAARALAAREAEADAAARRAAERFAAFQRLDDLRLSSELEERERELWPLDPAMVPALERWLTDADDVLRAAPRTPRRAGRSCARAGRGRPIREPRSRSRRRRAAPRRARARRRPRGGRRVRDPDRPPRPRGSRRDRRRRSASRRSRPPRRRVRAGSSREPPDQWLHDNLARLVARLEAMDAPSAYGCDARRDPEARASSRARSSSRVSSPPPRRGAMRSPRSRTRSDPAYGGLSSTPSSASSRSAATRSRGSGNSPTSRAGRLPRATRRGKLAIGEESSIVLVLVPGGAALDGRPASPRRRGASAGPRRSRRLPDRAARRTRSGSIRTSSPSTK